MQATFLIIVFLFGITIGSFLNVLIYRIPKHENFITERSHCMSCGYTLAWYDLIPLFSYIALGGKCRKCKEKISIQYPLIEALNGVLCVLAFARFGLSLEAFLYSFMFSALIVISVIDFRTFEIPLGLNIFIFLLGIVRLATDFTNWSTYLIGMFSVSLPLFLILVISGGNAMGGGDWKLMGAAGLLLGWKLNLLALFIGCVLGSVIHLTRMKVSKVGHELAFGPYLSMGLVIAALFGNSLINLYLGLFI